ncbi:MAG: hypothetical protein R3D55_01850 [Chloroflexota bacterium]
MLRVMVGEAAAVFRTDAERTVGHSGRPSRPTPASRYVSGPAFPRPARQRKPRLRATGLPAAQSLGDDTATTPYLEIDRKQIALRTGDDIVVDVVQFVNALTRRWRRIRTGSWRAAPPVGTGWKQPLLAFVANF